MRRLILGTGLGFNTPHTEQIRVMAEVGWDGFFTPWNETEGNSAFAALAGELGLVYQSVHAPFNKADVLWEEGEAGEAECDRMIACTEECARCEVPIVVMHTIIGMDKCTPTELGLIRFGRIFDRAAALGVTVALENTEGEIYLDRLLDRYSGHPAVGFCIDTGHEMCYNGRRDLIGKHGRHLVATHLNDNLGQTGGHVTFLDDSHLMPFDGVADWQKVAERLTAAGYAGHLTFELTRASKPGRCANDRYKDMSLKEYIEEALTCAKKFADMCK